MFTYVKFTANLWIANLVNEIHQWFSLCKVAFYNYSEKSNSHQKTHLQKQTEHHPEKKNCMKFFVLRNEKNQQKNECQPHVKNVEFSNFDTDSQLRSPQKKMPDDLRTSTRCAMDCAIKAREKPKALEIPERTNSNLGLKREYIRIMYIYIYRYASYVCIYKCICIICIWIHTSIQSETQENTSF